MDCNSLKEIEKHAIDFVIIVRQLNVVMILSGIRK